MNLIRGLQCLQPSEDAEPDTGSRLQSNYHEQVKGCRKQDQELTECGCQLVQCKHMVYHTRTEGTYQSSWDRNSSPQQH